MIVFDQRFSDGGLDRLKESPEQLDGRTCASRGGLEGKDWGEAESALRPLKWLCTLCGWYDCRGVQPRGRIDRTDFEQRESKASQGLGLSLV